MRDIEGAGTAPGFGLAPQPVDRVLGGAICREIGRYHIRIDIADAVGDATEAKGVVRREGAVADRVEYRRQLRGSGDRIARVEPHAAARLDLLGAQPEAKEVVFANLFADLDIGAVQRADRQ